MTDVLQSLSHDRIVNKTTMVTLLYFDTMQKVSTFESEVQNFVRSAKVGNVLTLLLQFLLMHHLL